MWQRSHCILPVYSCRRRLALPWLIRCGFAQTPNFSNGYTHDEILRGRDLLASTWCSFRYGVYLTQGLNRLCSDAVSLATSRYNILQCGFLDALQLIMMGYRTTKAKT